MLLAPLPQTLPLSAVVAVGIAFVVKHFACDFLLQTTWMATGKERPHDWFAPLATHAAVHAAATALLCLIFAPALVWFAAVDFVIHAGLDRAKGLVGRALGTSPASPVFWWLLGLDQALHGLTHFAFGLWLAAAWAGA